MMTFSLLSYVELLRSDLSRRSKGIYNSQTSSRAAFEGTAEEMMVLMLAHSLLRDFGKLTQEYVCYSLKTQESATYFFHARDNELIISKLISPVSNQKRHLLSAVYVPNIRTLRVKSSYFADADLTVFVNLSVHLLTWAHQIKFRSHLHTTGRSSQGSGVGVMTPQFRGYAAIDG